MMCNQGTMLKGHPTTEEAGQLFVKEQAGTFAIVSASPWFLIRAEAKRCAAVSCLAGTVAGATPINVDQGE